MSKEFGPRVAIVTLKELGLNCWSPARFIGAVRCARVMACNYLEKGTCPAVGAEVTHLREKAAHFSAHIHAKIIKLITKGGI
ncbi:MAG TPA: hypothetical protein VMW60_00635 [Dehalococcoidales bacterium]|nr:hypothetical protein [Dehalococcoidales bacterium]